MRTHDNFMNEEPTVTMICKISYVLTLFKHSRKITLVGGSNCIRDIQSESMNLFAWLSGRTSACNVIHHDPSHVDRLSYDPPEICSSF